MQDSSFFDESKEQSLLKARIVEKYFWAWASVIIGANKKIERIGYVDFFAGPGRYADESKSTPLLVLEKAIRDKKIRNRLVSVFNDANSEYAKNLEDAINLIEGIDTLKNKPIITNLEMGEEEVSVQILGRVKGMPALFFVDPWGYKGLSLELISSALKNWGCDCIFFFNYNRINMGINNPFVGKYMDTLFGTENAENLRTNIQTMTPSERELSIIEAISQALKEKAGEYVLPFCFKKEDGKRSSHYLIFVSKNKTGYKIMKDIMAQESSDSEQGVPSFEYTPATEKQLLLFGYSRPLDDLAEILLTEFAGRMMTMKQIFDRHNVGTRYISRNYKEILAKLESEGKIQTDPPASKRRKRKGEVTFADRVKVTFPPKDK